MSSGITIPGRKGFQPSDHDAPTAPPSSPSPTEARRAQRRQAARTTRKNTHAVILRFPHEVHADLERVAGAAGEHVGTWIRKRTEQALAGAAPPKLTEAEVRSIAARLLDDMCANLMPTRLRSFDKHDIEEVAISLGEMLADVGHAEERKT